MRTLLSLSLSPEKKKEFQQRAKVAQLTLSAYVLEALERDAAYISESELLQLSQKSKEEYIRGDSRELKSLADLM